MTDTRTKLGPAMASALQAVARMKGDAMPDAALWAAFLDDFRKATLKDDGPRQGSKPTGR